MSKPAKSTIDLSALQSAFDTAYSIGLFRNMDEARGAATLIEQIRWNRSFGHLPAAHIRNMRDNGQWPTPDALPDPSLDALRRMVGIVGSPEDGRDCYQAANACLEVGGTASEALAADDAMSDTIAARNLVSERVSLRKLFWERLETEDLKEYLRLKYRMALRALHRYPISALDGVSITKEREIEVRKAREAAIVGKVKPSILEEEASVYGYFQNHAEDSVYFILDGSKDHVKIGFTSGAVGKRRNALQTAQALYLNLLGTIPGSRNVEAALHEKFKHLRVRPNGEWFLATDELLTYIETNCRNSL